MFKRNVIMTADLLGIIANTDEPIDHILPPTARIIIIDGGAAVDLSRKFPSPIYNCHIPLADNDYEAP